MCYAIPGKVVSVDGNTATLDYFGERRKAAIIPATGNPKPETGNYVYAQGGIIVDVVSEAEALPILAAWKEKFFELKKADDALAETKTKKDGNDGSPLADILAKAESGTILTNTEMKKILGISDSDTASLESIFSTANRIRAKNIRNACCVHGIIEFSNNCKNECAYCGINKNNKTLARHRMSPDEIVATAEHAVKQLGFRALVLQSGEDDHYTDDILVSIIKRIRGNCGVLLFVSIGERSVECYGRLYEAGAYGALIRFETSNKKLYSALRPGKKLEDRLSLIKELKRTGFILATGFMAGLPGATGQDLINDILLTRSLKPDMFSFGPFLPHPQTPLASARAITPEYALKTIALARIAAPGSHIVVTTALETLGGPDARRRALLAGANSLMINVTPEKFRKSYEIYPGKAGVSSPVSQTIKETLSLLYSLGRAPTDLGLKR